MLTAQPADPCNPFLLASAPSGRATRQPGGRKGVEGSTQTTLLKCEGTRWMAEAAERRGGSVFLLVEESEKDSFFQPCQHLQWIGFVAIVQLLTLPPPAPSLGWTFKMGGWVGSWGGSNCLCVVLIFWVVCIWIGSRPLHLTSQLYNYWWTVD